MSVAGVQLGDGTTIVLGVELGRRPYTPYSIAWLFSAMNRTLFDLDMQAVRSGMAVNEPWHSENLTRDLWRWC